MVVAPTKTPRTCGSSNKTDRLDCQRLAEFAEKDLLRSVAIPTPQEEQTRELVRLRETISKEVRRTKNQIKSFLLRYSIKQPAGLKDWAQHAVQALRNLDLPPQLKFALASRLANLDHLLASRLLVRKQIESMVKQPQYGSAVKRLKTHPAVGNLIAMEFLAEIYQPRRFKNHKQVAAYVGLAPRVHQSGLTKNGGPLLKAGRGHLRSLLTEAAWTWIRIDSTAKQVFNRLYHNTGSKQKAVVAMARRMLVNLWMMHTRQMPYRALAA